MVDAAFALPQIGELCFAEIGDGVHCEGVFVS